MWPGGARLASCTLRKPSRPHARPQPQTAEALCPPYGTCDGSPRRAGPRARHIRSALEVVFLPL